MYVFLLIMIIACLKNVNDDFFKNKMANNQSMQVNKAIYNCFSMIIVVACIKKY